MGQSIRRKLSLVAAVLAVAAVAVGGTLLVTGGDDDTERAELPAVLKDSTVLKAPDDAFELRYPKAWEEIDSAKVGAEAGDPVATLRRRKRDGTVIVQRSGRLEGGMDVDRMAASITKRLKKQIDDFKLVQSGAVTLPAGKAFSYTFVRSESGTVQNLTVVPRGERTYTLTSVLAPKAESAAAEVAAIIRSFDPQS